MLFNVNDKFKANWDKIILPPNDCITFLKLSAFSAKKRKLLGILGLLHCQMENWVKANTEMATSKLLPKVARNLNTSQSQIHFALSVLYLVMAAGI